MTLQAVSEYYVVATRKGHMPPDEAARQAEDWLAIFTFVTPSAAAVRSALQAAVDRRASYWDALLVATAQEGGCTAILTEDMDDGSTLGGVRIVNPFGQAGLTTEASALLSPPNTPGPTPPTR